MSILNFFFPQVIHLPDTRYNQNLYIHFYGNREPTLIGNSLIQSGFIMRHIWSRGLRGLLPSKFEPEKVLLLGVGSGSNTRLIRDLYPKSKITGVEIDQGMIDIARKYCGLSKIKNLKIIIADAFDYAKNLDEQFDLVLVDCFDGKYIPTKLERLDFYSFLKNHSRFVLTNRLWYGEHVSSSQAFMNKLAGRFNFIKVHTRTNIVVSLV